MSRKSRSRIEELGVQELVEDLLDSNATYEDIRSAVREATGETISDAALSRYRTRWTTARERLERAAKEAEAITRVLADHPDGDLASAGMGLLMGKLVKRFSQAEESFETADLLELGHLLVKATRANASTEAVKSKMAAVDRPALYLECLKELTDYLTREKPSALDALADTFDGFIETVRKTYAQAY